MRGQEPKLRETSTEERLKQQAENRRKLLASLPKGAEEMVRKDFAKLGLFQ